MDLAAISEATNCGMCKSRMTIPKCLPCGHSFCRKCVDETHRHLPRNTNEAECPICRKQFVFSLSGADDLPDNIDLKNLIEVFEKANENKIDSSTVMKCQKCPERAATKTCVECNNNLCNQCCEMHDKVSDQEKHHVYEIASLSESEQKTLKDMAKVTAKCEDHDLFPNRYCLNKSCMRLVCPECCLGLHKDHDLQILSERAPHSKDLMKKTSSKAEILAVNIRDEAEHFEQLITELKKEKQSFSNRLKLHFKTFRKNTEKYENNLLGEATIFFNKQIAKLEENREALTSKENVLSEMVSEIKVVQFIGTDAYLVSQQHRFDRNLQIIKEDRMVLKKTDDVTQIELEDERDPDRFLKGSISRLKMAHKSKLVDEMDHAYADGKSATGSNRNIRTEDGKDESYYDEVSMSYEMPPRRKFMSALQLNLPRTPDNPSHPYVTRMSSPDLRVEGANRYSNLDFEYPTRLTFEKESHITCSSTISGIALTKDNDIVAVFGNGRMVCVFINNEQGRPSTSGCNVKRNWIKPWDAAAAFDFNKGRKLVYVTDSDEQNGHVVSFEVKRRDIGRCKVFISLNALQPKGITTKDNDIYVCLPEQQSVYVYQNNKEFKRKIDLRMCTYPIHICCINYTNDNVLAVSDGKRGTLESSSIVFLRRNGEEVSRIRLETNAISQIDADSKRTIFAGDSESPVIHAIVKDRKYRVDGDYTNISQTTAIAVDTGRRIIVGHSKGIDILQIDYRYGETCNLSPKWS